MSTLVLYQTTLANHWGFTLSTVKSTKSQIKSTHNQDEYFIQNSQLCRVQACSYHQQQWRQANSQNPQSENHVSSLDISLVLTVQNLLWQDNKNWRGGNKILPWENELTWFVSNQGSFGTRKQKWDSRYPYNRWDVLLWILQWAKPQVPEITFTIKGNLGETIQEEEGNFTLE